MSSAGDIDKEISFKVADRPVKRPRSFKDVRSLSYSNLLSHCRAANIITKGISRHALEVLLCHKLHLSTTGGHDVVFGPKLEDHCLDATETKEFERFTPTYVQSLQGWTKNISNIPEIDVGTVKKYLLASPSQDPDFTKDSLKRYKLSRSYEHISAKNIHSVMYNSLTESKTFCLVKAQCNPSQSGDSARVKWLHVVLDKMTGEPYGAFCVCAVGKGQACSHVGALLFLLCEIVASGAENLPDDESVTDVLCPWSLPKGAKVHPVKAEDVIVRSTDKQGPTVDNYTSQVAPELSPDDNYQRILQLLSDVRNANSNSCMPAIVNIVDISTFRTVPLPSLTLPSELPDKCFDFDIPVSTEITTTTYPIPVYRIPHPTFNSVYDDGFEKAREKLLQSIVYSSDDIENIERITRGQSASHSNDTWMDQRKATITGTKIHRILSFYEHGKAKPENIVKDIMKYNFQELNTTAIQWGRKHEQKAVDSYITELKRTHLNVDIHRPGLLVHNNYPFLRVSPDALVSCSCHGKRVVEVKCPYSCRNIHPATGVAQKQLDFILNCDGEMILKQNHSRGYYEQVTMQMVLSATFTADLVVWTKVGHITIHLKLVKEFWEQKVLPSLIDFYTKYVSSEILTGRIHRGLHLFSDCPLELKHEHGSLNEVDIGNNKEFTHENTSSISNNDINQSESHEKNYSSTSLSVLEENKDREREDWKLGCQNNCRNDRAPRFSRVRDQLIACNSNLVCDPYTRYHFFCEGFRHLPKSRKMKYICTKCREQHPEKILLDANDGFYE